MVRIHRDVANAIDKIRKGVHQWAEDRLVHFVVLTLFYGGATVTGVGILIILIAWILSDNQEGGNRSGRRR